MGKLGKRLKRSRLEASLEEQHTDGGALDLVECVRVSAALAALDLHFYHSAAAKPLRTVLFPLLSAELASGVHFEAAPVAVDTLAFAQELTLSSCAALTALCARPDAVAQLRGCKELRRALYPLVLDLGEREGVRKECSTSSAISAALRGRDWAAALARLRELRTGGKREALKLGSLQRWTNACDVALGEGLREVSESQLWVLDSIIRLSAGLPYSATAPHSGAARIVRHPLWKAPPVAGNSTPQPSGEGLGGGGGGGSGSGKVGGGIEARVVHTVPSALRRPPCPLDLHVFASPPGEVEVFGGCCTPALDVPGVPGARLLPGALSAPECGALIQLLESIGFSEDAVPGVDCVHLLADKATLLDPLFHRLSSAPGFLPSSLPPAAHAVASGSSSSSSSAGGGANIAAHTKLVGINARWRCFRYTAGVTYKSHIDGAWSGAGLTEKGEFSEDVFGGALSRFTLLFYLNGGFKGGGTTFFLGGEEEGVIDARGVEPAVGAALVFPHGEALGSLVHEGSEVEAGGHVKYLVRTEVLYTVSS